MHPFYCTHSFRKGLSEDEELALHIAMSLDNSHKPGNNNSTRDDSMDVEFIMEINNSSNVSSNDSKAQQSDSPSPNKRKREASYAKWMPKNEEEEVLFESSIISQHIFLPWNEHEVSSTEQFQYKNGFVVTFIQINN
jgi:hypothetical protein